MSQKSEHTKEQVIGDSNPGTTENNQLATTSKMSGERSGRKAGRRPGRRGSKMDVRAKLERSRQSARECRARKKLRYQYLEDLVVNREKAVFALRDELELYKQFCREVDEGHESEELRQRLNKEQKQTITDHRIKVEPEET